MPEDEEDSAKPSQLDAILGRALRDDDFRETFIDDPLRAALAEGYDLTYADRIALKSINQVSAKGFLDRFIRDPGQVMWCTDKTCYEFESNLGTRFDRVVNPAVTRGDRQ